MRGEFAVGIPLSRRFPGKVHRRKMSRKMPRAYYFTRLTDSETRSLIISCYIMVGLVVWAVESLGFVDP